MVVQPREERLQGDCIYKIGLYERLKNFNCPVHSDKTKANDFKLKEARFRVEIRKKLFKMKVVSHWKRLPKEAGDDTSLDQFKARMVL